MSSKGRRILITGCNGQIGRALMRALADEAVVGADLLTGPHNHHDGGAAIVAADVTKKRDVARLIETHRPEWLFHLPAVMSGAAERSPAMAQRALRLNVDSLTHLLQLARRHHFRLFCPSTIAAFGPHTPKRAPDTTVMAPIFLYGITKAYNELLGDYFARRYGVDYRSLRLPGIIAPTPSVGIGTTDYAIDMIRAAKAGGNGGGGGGGGSGGGGSYNCYLGPATMLPMVHIDDCIGGIIKFMGVPRASLTRSVYNIQAMSFDPETLRAAIAAQTGRPLAVSYRPDHRQAIADSWPDYLDDTLARRDWGWAPQYDLTAAVRSLLDSFK